MTRAVVGLLALSVGIVTAGWAVARGARVVIEATAERDVAIPTTTVRRGDVAITVTAKGELQGGGVEPLRAPMAGAAELPITFLRETGERVEAGDVVVEFDASEQEYTLAEAEADLLEAEQELARAQAEARLALEEARLAVVTTEADLQIAELGQRENQFTGAIAQRRNELELERARNRHEQAVAALAHREATTGAEIRARDASVREARTTAETARQTMADLTLRAPSAGFVERGENTNGLRVIFSGMRIPTFQVGDAARPGQVVATIPDMSRWEVSAQIPETDRAFLEVGHEVDVRARALPGRVFRGRVSLLGGASGQPWNRTFNCRMTLDEADPALRPGMSVDLVIRIETLADALWVPSQAVFERDGRWFVYRETPDGYLTEAVTLVRRTDSQAVVTGIEEGAPIALARPDAPATAAEPDGAGPLGALPR